MGKIVLDRNGELRNRMFYRFNVQFNDDLSPERPSPEWMIAPRIPTNDDLIDAGEAGYLRIEELPKSEDRVEIKDCPNDPTHVMHLYYKTTRGDASGYNRLSPFVETSGLFFAISRELYSRLNALNVKGARLDPIKIIVNQSGLKNPEVWALQFVGTSKKRLPRFIDAANACPHCGKNKIVCEGCGYWNSRCLSCSKMMVRTQDEQNDGKMLLLEERPFRAIIEGSGWDGSDLIQVNGRKFASKRFIDWLLRIHAAPFYAEPVYFCVDGMSDEQKKWLDDLQKPFEF